MSARRAVRLLVLLSPTLALLAVGGWYAVRQARTPPPPLRPGGRLVVVVVFDQMRGDYLDRWASLFGTDGFERLKAGGLWYADAHLPYACSITGPGHASIGTGAPPAVHGIINNGWYDRAAGKRVYCATSDRPYPRVPPRRDAPAAGNGLSPDRLLAPTVADALRAATKGKGRAFSLGLKDRSAVLMGGREPTGCYCFDEAVGRFYTSAYYRERPHPWVEKFNASGFADRWFGQTWARAGDVADYDRLAGPDNGPGEPGGLGRTFPHPLAPGQAKPDGRYYSALMASPFGNEVLWELAKAAIAAEKLGQGDAPDLLCLGFPATDLIGHAYGPDSHEAIDATVRADRLLGQILDHLTRTLGEDRFAVVVTADHGVCPLPERSVREHPEAVRFEVAQQFGQLGEVLDGTFGKFDAAAGRWVEATDFPWFFLDERRAAAHHVPPAALEERAAQWLGNRPVSQTAFTRTHLLGPPLADPVGRMVQLGFHPGRCGDVCVVTRPWVLPTGRTSTGTTHGTPHDYDTHVPVLAAGVDLPPLGRRDERVSSLLIAPIVCRALGIPPPTEAREPLPAEFEVVEGER